MPRLNLLILFLAAAVSACSTPDPFKYPCPSYGTLKDADRVTAFRPGGEDITDVKYRVTLASTKLKCDYGRKRRLDVELKANLTIERGAALDTATVEVPYFVAVTRAKKFVLARQEFTQTFALSGQQLIGQTEIPVRIPLAEGTNGANYEVVIGLVLTPEQLDYNRKHPAP